jgi:hypothetical protein
MSEKKLSEELKWHTGSEGDQGDHQEDPEDDEPFANSEFFETNDMEDWAWEDSPEDKARQSLVRTGAIMLTDLQHYDITREMRYHGGEIEQLESAKHPQQLVEVFWAHLTTIRDYAEMTEDLLNELLSLENYDKTWEAFKESNVTKILLICESVFAGPATRYKARQRGISLKELEKKFISRITWLQLEIILRRKHHSFAVALENAFIKDFSDDYRGNKKSVNELAGAILDFRRTYLKELGKIHHRAVNIRKGKYWSKDNAAIKAGLYVDAAEASATVGNDAFVYLVDQFWNGTFYLAKYTFGGSVDATLYFHTDKSIKDEWRRIQKIPEKSEMPLGLSSPEPDWYNQKVFTSVDFIKTYGTELNNWLEALTERAKKTVAAETFMQYAYSVSPREKGTEVENSFYSLLKLQDLRPAEHNTYQGRVRDGGYVAVRLFNDHLFNDRTGLAFIGEKQVKELKYRQAGQNGTRIFVTFPEDYRQKVKNGQPLSSETRINLILETLQDSHWLFSILDA